MRLDHIAYRVADRDETARFFMDAFGYKVQAEFDIFFDKAKTDKATCLALEPPERRPNASFLAHVDYLEKGDGELTYHMPPEIFVSEGSPGSIVHEWVRRRGGIGGIHHLAYQVDSVEGKMLEWAERGWGDFTSAEVMTCPGLKQVFSKPHRLTGVIFEFIERDGYGFCKDNVKDLMLSTAGLDANMRDRE